MSLMVWLPVWMRQGGDLGSDQWLQVARSLLIEMFIRFCSKILMILKNYQRKKESNFMKFCKMRRLKGILKSVSDKLRLKKLMILTS